MTRGVYVRGPITLHFVLSRAALALVAILVLAWVGVLVRNHEVAHQAEARSFAPGVPAADRERDLDRLESAELLDPSVEWDLARASAFLLSGDAPAAVRVARDVTSREPENVLAWGALYASASQADPALARRAAAEIRRLSPLGPRLRSPR